jgi:hypothetical protein
MSLKGRNKTIVPLYRVLELTTKDSQLSGNWISQQLIPASILCSIRGTFGNNLLHNQQSASDEKIYNFYLLPLWLNNSEAQDWLDKGLNEGQSVLFSYLLGSEILLIPEHSPLTKLFHAYDIPFPLKESKSSSFASMLTHATLPVDFKDAHGHPAKSLQSVSLTQLEKAMRKLKREMRMAGAKTSESQQAFFMASIYASAHGRKLSYRHFNQLASSVPFVWAEDNKADSQSLRLAAYVYQPSLSLKFVEEMPLDIPSAWLQELYGIPTSSPF